MKHIKLFEDFSTSTSLTEDQIKWLDKCAKRGWNLDPSTGLIDVDGDFKCYQQGLTDFKGVAFGHVNGNFECYHNQLTSLEGAPQIVDGYFDCQHNQLTSLEGAPQKVGGGFYCGCCNRLTSLKGAPQKVGREFIIAWDYSSLNTMGILNWSNGWEKKGNADFLRTLFAKLKEISDIPENKFVSSISVSKSELTSMLLSLAGFDSVSDLLLSGKIPVGDKFEIYRVVKDSMPEVWDKVKDQLDSEGDTSELMDIGF
jgi:hypothetical protein